MKAKKVLFISQEIVPYVEQSEISTMGKLLPVAAQEDGREVRIFMPKWGMVNERRNQLHEVIRLSGMNLIINDTDHTLIIKVASMSSSRLQVYFIDNEDYFSKRQMSKDKTGKEYEDNGERAIFYVRGVLETVKKLRWSPDVIICQGWMSALVPFYLKTLFKDEPSFRDSKVIYLAQQDELKEPLGKDFQKSLFYKNPSGEGIREIQKDTYYYTDFIEMAAKYADGFMLGSAEIPDSVTAIFEKSEKPILNYSKDSEDFKQHCNAFYDEVFSAGKPIE